MKFVALISGGKDSIYSIMECVRNGHELLACAHLSRPNPPAISCKEEEEESYMYQTAASEAVRTLVEECLSVPFITAPRSGRSVNTDLVYDHERERRQSQQQHPCGNDDDSGSNTRNKDQQRQSTANLEPDEVEDLYQLLSGVITLHPNIQAVSSGAILSTYQRTRIESVCSRLNLTSLSYLWRVGPQRNVLRCMLQDGIDAVLVKTACPPGLIPNKHLGKNLGTLYYRGLFERLNKRYDFHMCGEGGEYETLVVDCPLFRRKLILDETEIIYEGENDEDCGVGVLRIIKCHAEEKDGWVPWVGRGAYDDDGGVKPLCDRILQPADESQEESPWDFAGSASLSTSTGGSAPSDVGEPTTGMTATSAQKCRTVHFTYLPHVKVARGGLFHISEIVCPSTLVMHTNNKNDIAEADLAVMEAQSILSILRDTLSYHNLAAQDVVMVHLYLSDIAHFAKINEHYRNFFGTVLPPSRSCVGVGRNVLPFGRRVMLDCLAQLGSGAYMRSSSSYSSSTIDNSGNADTAHSHLSSFITAARLNPHHQLRSTLHVQSISHWAPVCVGPYSQANTVRSGLLFLAGQVGLIPRTMTLRDTWKGQLRQCWTNVASVLDALDNGEIDNCLGGLVYLSESIFHENEDDCWVAAERICRVAIRANGGIQTGFVDETAAVRGDRKDQNGLEKFGGYEDEETYQALSVETGEVPAGKEEDELPLLMVSIPQMPVGALTEVELICGTRRASTCLGVESSSLVLEYHRRTNEKDECSVSHGAVNWDIGHEAPKKGESSVPNMEEMGMIIESKARSVGKGCAAVITVAASIGSSLPDRRADSIFPVDAGLVLDDMVYAAIKTMEEESLVGLHMDHALHVRLYYVEPFWEGEAAEQIAVAPCADGVNLRNALLSVLNRRWCPSENRRNRGSVNTSGNIPAYTLVPVQRMKMTNQFAGKQASRSCLSRNKTTTLMAMQVLVADLVHMETEMWVHHGRV